MHRERDRASSRAPASPRAGVRFGGSQHALQQIHVHDVLPLMDPEGFHHIVLVRRLGFVEPRDPLSTAAITRCRIVLSSSIFASVRV